jgi:sulfane dehydrogenase subunit SoxC
MLSESVLPTVGDGSGLESDQKIHVEELQLALRNKAQPLEGLHYDVTPIGLHYTLVHYDIPIVDGTTWRLDVDGQVQRQLSLTLQELQQRPQQTLRVTLQCAGDGRVLLHPRPISQPWLTGAVGTAEWTGTPLHLLLEEAGVGDDVTEILFTGLDHRIEGGVEQHYQRSFPCA